MHDSPDPQTPDAVVARRIVDRFVDEGLLLLHGRERFWRRTLSPWEVLLLL